VDLATEAMQTLYDLMASPVANPFTIDIVAPSAVDAAAKAQLLATLPLVAHVLSIDLSAHPGTASMGQLLLLSLGCTLISSLAFVPALLAAVGAPRRLGRRETSQG
jgi:hypothetical protein